MYIGLIAHDAKKKLMQNFCIAYRGILSKHELYATGTTGRLIEEVTNLTLHKYLPGHLGGSQQLGAQIEHNQIDLLIFLRDPLAPKPHEPDVNDVVRLCDIHNIPMATNLATAELLVKALDRGDMEWLEMYNRTCGRTDALRYQHADRLWCPRSGTGIFISRTGSADDASGRCRAGALFCLFSLRTGICRRRYCSR